MKKRCLLAVILALLVASLGAFPSFAGDKIDLEVNGDQVTFFDVFEEDGISMVSVEAFARFAGADVDWVAEDAVQITEHGHTLEFVVGENKALLAGEQVTLPCAPVRSGDKVYIPLRFASDAFGFNVSWDAGQKMAMLSRVETRDGMTASDLLVKSSQVCQDINTYTMDGAMDMKMKIVADGKEIKEVPQKIKIEMTGQIQNKPMQFHIKQKMAPVSRDQAEEMVVETYMTTEKMYMKAPGQGWVVQDTPFSPAFWQEQQDIQSNPIKAAAQMEEMGILLNFGNDIQINGQDYYVVHASLDMDKYKQGYEKMMQQAVRGMQQADANVDPQQMQEQMQSLINNISLDYYYTTYINKESLVTDIIKFDAKMDCAISNPGALSGQQNQDTPKEIKLNYDLQGEFTIGGLGDPFQAPDVSSAQEVTLRGKGSSSE